MRDRHSWKPAPPNDAPVYIVEDSEGVTFGYTDAKKAFKKADKIRAKEMCKVTQGHVDTISFEGKSST